MVVPEWKQCKYFGVIFEKITLIEIWSIKIGWKMCKSDLPFLWCMLGITYHRENAMIHSQDIRYNWKEKLVILQPEFKPQYLL